MSTSPISYVPKPGSIPHSVCTFFAKNPEEELSTADVAQKFDLKPDQVPMHLTLAVKAGLLRRVRPSVFAAGEQLANWQPNAQPVATPRSYTRLEVQSVKIIPGRPLPAADTQRGHTSPYAELWARMKVGDSVDLSRKRADSFRSWAKRNKKQLATRQLGVDLYGCWKTAE